MMKGVCVRGTGASAAKLGLQIAGKTGTTNDYTDAWFVGMTPKHTIAVWIGYDTKRTLGPKSAGADVALPVWIRIVQKMKEAGIVSETDDFEVPTGIVQVPIDLDTGYRATPSCRKVVLMAFVNGTQPTELCGDEPHAVTALPPYLQKAMYAPKRGEQTGDEIRFADAPKLMPPPREAMPKPSAEGGPPG
jgi:penicillin-binding protein 1A